MNFQNESRTNLVLGVSWKWFRLYWLNWNTCLLCLSINVLGNIKICFAIKILILDRHGLSDTKAVENLQNKIINSLRDHVTYNADAQRKPHYFSRILDKLPQLRSLSVQGLQRIFYLKLEDLVPAPPLIERMFASSIPF